MSGNNDYVTGNLLDYLYPQNIKNVSVQWKIKKWN